MSEIRDTAIKQQSMWWVHLLLIGACVISIYPLLRIFSVSLRPGDQFFSTDLSLIPSGATLDSYRAVFRETEFISWLVNSLLITGFTACIGVSLAASAAYAISRFRFPGRTGAMVFLMGTQMVPVVLLLLPLYFLLQKLDLIDTYTGVIVAYSVTTMPFCVWLLKGYFDTVPRSLEEAAQVDGLSEIASFWRVVLPLSTPALAIALLFSVTQAWNEYIVARVILQSSEFYTWPLGLFELQGDFDTRWGLFASASICVTVPVMIVFLWSSKWLLSGLTLGGAKG